MWEKDGFPNGVNTYKNTKVLIKGVPTEQLGSMPVDSGAVAVWDKKMTPDKVLEATLAEYDPQTMGKPKAGETPSDIWARGYLAGQSETTHMLASMPPSKVTEVLKESINKEIG